MPQISSQAMAYAQAQAQAQAAQSQYRHHSSYHHGAAQGQHQFPPRTHRRSIQPLTLDQQQPKGGSFRYVRNQADLWPQKGSQKYRSIDDYGQSISPLRALTALLTRTYSHCNQNFKYESSYNPRRVLTKPSKPVHNEGYDNEDYDYILYVSDILGSEERQRYLILDVLGQGTFGQVVKCQNLKTNAIVAVKVIKNRPAYFNQSMMEVTVLELLNERYDPEDRHHILRLHDTFIHRRHLCLVFELLSVNLYELIKQNQFRGLSMSLVRVLTAQLLDALCVLNEARIIHCDLKPENVLLKNLETPTIKVIDFGSACHEQQTVYTYIQSRFYRSPEVLVGLPYSSSIDICMLPAHMLEIGKTAHEFFEVRPDHISHGYNRSGAKSYRLKSIETYSRERKVIEQPSKRYFQATTLPDIINSYPLQKKGMTSKEIEKEMLNRLSFINFLQGLLNLNPIERWSPHQAKLHPFITGEPFTGNFVPPTIPKKPPTVENSIRLEPTMPGRSSKARSGSLSASSPTPVLSASSVNTASEELAQHEKVDPTLGSTHLQPSKPGTSPTGIHTRSPSSVLEDPLVPTRDSPGGSPATPSSPLVNLDVPSSGTADGLGLSGVGNARNTGPQHSTGHQTQSFSGPTHHGHRPRATTMGTVEIPKNMVQLAAAMTPQGQVSSGISGTSGLSRRVEPDDSAAEDMFESSSPYQGNMGSFGNMGSSGHGLRQIPERSEQNSPVQEGSTGASSGANSRSSTEEPSQHDQGTQSSHQQRKSQQYASRQYVQPPHRYLHRSGSDAGSMASTHTFRSSFGGENTQSLQASGHGQGSTFVGSSSSSSVSGTSAAGPELTPLQRMQQQLNQSQGQQKQRQQQYGYHFGYPPSGSSPSEGSGSVSGGDSNNSSRQDRSSEPDFDMDEGSLRQMDLGSGASRSNRSPLIYGTEAEDLHESRSGNESSGQSRGGIRSDSAGRGNLYGRSRGGASPYRGTDGSDSPHFETLTDSGSPAGIDPQGASMDTINLSGGFDSGLSNVEEEEEEEDEEDGGDEEEPARVQDGDSLGTHESLAGDLEVHGDYTRLFDCTVDASSPQSGGDHPLIGCASPLSNVSEAPTSPSFLQQHVVTTPQLYFQELGKQDPPYILFSTPNHDRAYSGCSVDGPEWTADRPITIHNQEYTSLADHLADLDGNMTFLNKYRSPESLKYDYTASPPYVPEYIAYDDAVDSPMPALPCPANCSCRSADWEDDWRYTRKDDMCPDSPPYVPMDYNTLRPDIDPDDDKYYVLSPDCSYLDKSDMSPIPPLTLSPPSYEFDYTQYGIPTPAYTASS
ncbi:dual specificity protein kinase yak1 [Mortierella sp. NVP85]|nr:dual specificity protein kinase yak1 [Mortierella sp. NVP85]